MAILDRLFFSFVKLAIAGLSAILVFILAYGAYAYYQKVEQEKLTLIKRQKAKRIENDKSSYELTIKEILESPNLTSMKKLNALIDSDDLFLQGLGWEMQEGVCQINKCNLRYIRDTTRLFQYVALRKGKEEYQPTFTEDELIYQDVLYPIPMDTNKKFTNTLGKLETCNLFISKTYKFKTLIRNTSNDVLKFELPSNLFSFSGKYEWALYSNIQKGTLSLETSDLFFLELFGDNYKGNLLRYESYQIKDERVLADFTYYCI